MQHGTATRLVTGIFILCTGIFVSAEGPRVAPVDEILIISPQVDSELKPRPVFVKDEVTGGKHIEIPPTVIVHRYYYTGDRNFQGPMLPGGPSVVVANHPVTGEQISLEAQLMPGAPRIYYTKQAIRYDYGGQSISIRFGCEPLIAPSVVVHQHPGWAVRTHNAAQNVKQSSSSWYRRTGIPGAAQKLNASAKEGLHATADGIQKVGAMVTDPVTSFLESTPASSVLHSPDATNAGGIVNELNGTIQTNR